MKNREITIFTNDTLALLLYIVGWLPFIHFHIYQIYYSPLGTISVSCFLLLCLFINSFRKKAKKVSFNVLITMTILLCYTVGVLYINRGGLGSAFTIINLCLCIILAATLDWNRAVIKKLSSFTLIALFLTIAVAFISGGPIQDHIAGYNSNTVGFIILLAYMLYSMFEIMLDQKKQIFISIGLILVCSCAILITEARMSLIGLAFFCFLRYIFKRLGRNNINTYLYLCILCIGIIVPFLYTFIFNNQLIGNLKLLNKDLFSGRQALWTDLLQIIFSSKVDFLWGPGSKGMGDVVANTHNAYFSILLSFGVLGVIFIFYTLFLCIRKVELCACRKGTAALIVYFTIMLVSCFENVLFASGILINFLLGIALSCAYEKDETWKKKNLQSPK